MSKPTKYRVVTGCANDKTGKRFKAGDVVTAKDFSDYEIKWLLEKGTIKAAKADGTKVES
jgi:hypothetical protein